MLDLNEIIEKLRHWTYEAGQYQLEKQEKGFSYEIKSTETDIVTEVDKWSDKFITDHIRKDYPDHSILSEEQGKMNEGDVYEWIIDPIDGTTNYLHGFPIHSISIALEKNGQTILGAVYIPRLREFFYAIKGQGAFLNDKPIHIACNNKLNQCLLSTGFPYDKHISQHNNLAISNSLIPKVQDIRRMGSAAVDLCYTACGRLDGYWEFKISKWDIAAGKLIVEEAGGRVDTSLLKKENGEWGINLVSGNEEVVRLIKEEINKVYPYFEAQ
ncbi:MAG: inositol monophosphatase [Clostridia bacterium]|jgi:myo-inositol-1(or 4)-monophosphatase|nr:inositol monophosphatase [Clostridia bacterium]